MKERPILLNAEMVRAVLDGRKTQTRRMVDNVDSDNCLALRKPTKTRNSIYTHVMDAPKHGICPFGAVGDRLWVRETFSGNYLDDDQIQDIKGGRDKASDLCEYRADYPDGYQAADGWTPSIHMPRWASRITLEITGVRVERLRELSEEDAKSEGVTPPGGGVLPGWEHRINFRELWMSIYGTDNWEANPWVWVIEFKRLDNADKAG